MQYFALKTTPIPKDRLRSLLEEREIRINRYAETYIAHPGFRADRTEEKRVVIASLREIGLENGGSLADIFQSLPALGLGPCAPDTGLYLRLAWTAQPQSRDTVLTGTHRSPEGAVTVLSEPLEREDAFPKGLYLRNVDGKLWLRGYICDGVHRFSGDDLFAFEAAESQPVAAP